MLILRQPVCDVVVITFVGHEDMLGYFCMGRPIKCAHDNRRPTSVEEVEYSERLKGVKPSQSNNTRDSLTSRSRFKIPSLSVPPAGVLSHTCRKNPLAFGCVDFLQVRAKPNAAGTESEGILNRLRGVREPSVVLGGLARRGLQR